MSKAISRSPKSSIELVTYRRPGKPNKFNNPDEFAILVEAYFERCDTLRDLPTITGLAVHLDTDRKTLYNYRSKDEYFPTIKRALVKCEAAIESRAMQGGLNATMAIFSLKNNYGWVDQSQIDNTVHLPIPILGAVSVQPDNSDTQNLIP